MDKTTLAKVARTGMEALLQAGMKRCVLYWMAAGDNGFIIRRGGSQYGFGQLKGKQVTIFAQPDSIALTYDLK